MNEKKYELNFNQTGSVHTHGLIEDIIAGGMDALGVNVVYIPRDAEDPTDIDYFWGELKKKDFTRGFGMRMLTNESVNVQGSYNFSKFGFLDFALEDTFYIPIREFYQRMAGYVNVTQTNIIDGVEPSGYSEVNILDYQPKIADLIWLPLHNKLFSITLVDDKENSFFQKYSVYKISAKLYKADHRDAIDITGSEGHGLVPDALDIAPEVPKVKDIQDTERLSDASIDPTVTGNTDPDSPKEPLNKNTEIAKSGVKDSSIDGDIFGNF